MVELAEGVRFIQHSLSLSPRIEQCRICLYPKFKKKKSKRWKERNVGEFSKLHCGGSGLWCERTLNYVITWIISLGKREGNEEA